MKVTRFDEQLSIQTETPDELGLVWFAADAGASDTSASSDERSAAMRVVERAGERIVSRSEGHSDDSLVIEAGEAEICAREIVRLARRVREDVNPTPYPSDVLLLAVEAIEANGLKFKMGQPSPVSIYSDRPRISRLARLKRRLR